MIYFALLFPVRFSDRFYSEPKAKIIETVKRNKTRRSKNSFWKTINSIDFTHPVEFPFNADLTGRRLSIWCSDFVQTDRIPTVGQTKVLTSCSEKKVTVFYSLPVSFGYLGRGTTNEARSLSLGMQKTGLNKSVTKGPFFSRWFQRPLYYSRS